MSDLSEKLDRVPVGFVLMRRVTGVEKPTFLVRRWRDRENRWSPYIGDARVFKSVPTAFNIAESLSIIGARVSMCPVYVDPRRAGMDALIA